MSEFNNNIAIENYKDILGFEGLYQVSDFGNVRSLRSKKHKLLKPYENEKGYLTVSFNVGVGDNIKICKYKVHRLVAKAFIENKEKLHFVNHKDKNKKNNAVANLEWVSSRENDCHKYKKIKTTSDYVGVYFNKKTLKWHSQIKVNKKSIHLGSFNDEFEAYQARINYEKKNNIVNRYL